MPYSLDLRKRVVAAIKSGMTSIQVSEIFSICRRTIYNWLRLEKEAGDLNPKTGFQKGHSHGITDHAAFRQFVDKHPDYTQEEIAAHFSVGSSTVSRVLQKISYSRKKRVKPTLKEMRKKEQLI